MDKLLTPDFGLTFWTVVNFLLLVFVLGKFAWKPIIGALEARENKIAEDKKAAQDARDEAQKIKAELETRLEGIAKEANAKMKQVEDLAQAQKKSIIDAAKHTSETLISQAKSEIEAQKAQALGDIKKEIADLTVLAAQKVAGIKVDAKADENILRNVLNDIEEFNA